MDAISWILSIQQMFFIVILILVIVYLIIKLASIRGKEDFDHRDN